MTGRSKCAECVCIWDILSASAQSLSVTSAEVRDTMLGIVLRKMYSLL